MQVKVFDDDGVELPLPKKFEVCPTCKGHGTSSAYLGAFTSEDFADDPDFMERYLAGDYDRPCERCSGEGVVEVVDEEALTPELRRLYDEAVEGEIRYRQEVDMERRFGA